MIRRMGYWICNKLSCYWELPPHGLLLRLSCLFMDFCHLGLAILSAKYKGCCQHELLACAKPPWIPAHRCLLPCSCPIAWTPKTEGTWWTLEEGHLGQSSSSNLHYRETSATHTFSQCVILPDVMQIFPCHVFPYIFPCISCNWFLMLIAYGLIYPVTAVSNVSCLLLSL